MAENINENSMDTTAHQLKLKKYKEILMKLEKDKFIHAEERQRLSKLSNKNHKNSANSDISKQIDSRCYVCNVIINLANKENFINCFICKNIICTQKQCAIEKANITLNNTTIPVNNNNNGNEKVEQQLITPTKTCKLCNSFMKGSQSACDWLLEELHVKFANNSTQQQQQSLKEKSIEWNKIDDTLIVPVDQRDTVREYIEELVASLIGGGSLDNVPIGQLYSNLQCLPRNENEVNVDGSYDSLKMLVERIIEQVFKIPEILDHSGVPGRPRHQPPEFDPKKYEELLATAVLNKIVEKFELEQKILSQRRGSDYYKKLDKNHNQWIKRSVESPTGSTSSDEPKSDNSSNHPEHPMSLNITSDIEEKDRKSLSFDDLLSTPISPTSDEEYLSDYIQNHRIALPDVSTDEFLEDKYLETLASNGIISTNGNSGGVSDWQENWLFKKKKSKQNEPTTSTISTQSIAMLVPSPTEEVKALIGDKTADEMSDLSEAGSSDSESDDDDSLSDKNNDNDLPHILIESKTLIGGKNEVKSFDESQQTVEELLQPDSLISLHSTASGGRNNSPIIMEAKNEMIFVNVDNNNSEAVMIINNNSSSAQIELETKINVNEVTKSENKEYSPSEELLDMADHIPVAAPRKPSKTNIANDFEANPLTISNNTITNTISNTTHINTLTISNQNVNASEHATFQTHHASTIIHPHTNQPFTRTVTNYKNDESDSDENISNNHHQHDKYLTSLKLTDNLKNVIVLNTPTLELDKGDNYYGDGEQIYTTTTQINFTNSTSSEITIKQQEFNELIEFDQTLHENNISLTYNDIGGIDTGLLSLPLVTTNQLPPIENYINKVIPSEFDISLDSVGATTDIVATANSNDIIEKILPEDNIIQDNTVPKAIYICSKPALVAVELATDDQITKSIITDDKTINNIQKIRVSEVNELSSVTKTIVVDEKKYTNLNTPQHLLEIRNIKEADEGLLGGGIANLSQISNSVNLISDKQEIENTIVATDGNDFGGDQQQQTTDSDDASDFVILKSSDIYDLQEEQREYDKLQPQQKDQEPNSIGKSTLLPILVELKNVDQNINHAALNNQFTTNPTNQSNKTNNNKRPKIFDTILKDESLINLPSSSVTDEVSSTESTEVELRATADLPGSIAEREHLKWKNAQDIPNNPYSAEALQKRLSSGKSNKGILDIRDISPTKQQSDAASLENYSNSQDDEILKLSTSNSNNDDSKLKIVMGAGEPDHIRYGRDYYINDANSETRKKQFGINKLSTTLYGGDNSTDSGVIYTAQPVHILEEYNSFHLTSTTEELSSPTTQHQPNDSSLTLSEDSDTTRIYDLNKRETSLIRVNVTNTTKSTNENQDFSAQTPPSTPIDESIDLKYQQSPQSLQSSTKHYYLEDGITFQQLNQVKKAFEQTPVKSVPPTPTVSTKSFVVQRSSSFQFNKATTMSGQEVFIRESTSDDIPVEIAPEVPPSSTSSPSLLSSPPQQITVDDTIITPEKEEATTNIQEFIAISEEPQMDATPTKMVIEEEVLPVLPSVKALAKSFIEKRSSTDDQPINRPKSIDWYITQDNGVENGNGTNHQNSDTNFNNGAANKYESFSSSQIDDAFPNYNHAYHPVAQHSITARSVPTKIREELKKSSTIFETNNNNQQGGHSSPERSPSPVLVPGILKNNVAFFENLKNSK